MSSKVLLKIKVLKAESKIRDLLVKWLVNYNFISHGFYGGILDQWHPFSLSARVLSLFYILYCFKNYM